MIQNGKRVKKRKTSISKSEDAANPTWNEPFTFNLQSSYLHNAAIEVNKDHKWVIVPHGNGLHGLNKYLNRLHNYTLARAKN